MSNLDQWGTHAFAHRSHDDQFIARTTEDTISVYEVPSMGLLDKKSFKVTNVQEAIWSPTQNILAYWVPEKDNIPVCASFVIEHDTVNPLVDLSTD